MENDTKNGYRVRRRNGFMSRNGLRLFSQTLQINDLDKETRIVLKNEVIELISEWQASSGNTSYEFEHRIAKLLAKDLFCLSLNSRESTYESTMLRLYDVFDCGTFGEVFDTIEFLVEQIKIFERVYDISYSFVPMEHRIKDLQKIFNELFEKECVGYRFLNGVIVPITSEQELVSVDEAESNPNERVAMHVRKAVEFFASRDSKNYKSTIAECSHALECLINIMAGETGKSLGDALKEFLKKGGVMDPALRKSIDCLYGYLSNSPGVRHDSNRPESNEGFEEAKFMIVYTSALINYLQRTYKPGDRE